MLNTLSTFLLVTLSVSSIAQEIKITRKIQINVSNAMSKVMWEGKLAGNIDLDTIQQKEHLYGIGPVEYLKGEILILDGQSYIANVVNDTSMLVQETFNTKAPFFVYATVPQWMEYMSPNNIKNIKQLESYLLGIYNDSGKEPFTFRIKAMIDKATIHLVNLPNGKVVQSPDDAHTGQTNYTLQNREVEIIGFFSTKHKGVFTHHDSFLHMHLITIDKTLMGHLDSITFSDGPVKLYLP